MKALDGSVHFGGSRRQKVTCKYDEEGEAVWVCGRDEVPVACEAECQEDEECRQPCKTACRKNRQAIC